MDFLDPDLLNTLEFDHVFLAAGRSLVVACAFENKCRSLLNFLSLKDIGGKGEMELVQWINAQIELVEKKVKISKSNQLIQMLNDPDIGLLTEASLLDEARKARNKIAHEILAIDSKDPSIKAENLLAQLRTESLKVVRADFFLSKVLTMIETKESVSDNFSQSYSDQILKWIFDTTSLQK